MSINLKKNEAKLKAAYSDVVSDKSDTNWALFGYEGNSNDLKVVETGEDGWEEMVEELNSGKPMYAFCRVTDPNTKLPKNVLVNWMGEGVPASRKGVCARHVLDVERFFRGAHVTINARSEDDVDEATILEKVSKASGANFSFHKEKARPMPAAGPVGSVYQRARPQQEISAQSRDKFWSQQEKEEEERQKREKRTMAETKRQEELERRKREEEDAKRRDRAAKERAQAIDEQKKREQEAFRRERDDREAALQARLKRRDEEVDSELERERREAEQQQVQNRSVSSGVRAKLAGFEKKAEEQRQKPPPPAPKRTRPFQPPQPIAKPEPEYEPEPEPEPQYEPEPEPQYEPEPEPQYEPEPEPQYEPEPEPIPPYEPEPEPEPQYEPEPEPEPEPQYGDDQDDVYDDVAEQKLAPGGHDYGQLEDAYYDDTQGFQDTGDAEQIYDDVEQTEQPAAAAGEGLTAKTVYDYEAEDETEISFDVDEIITNIEQIDEGWWRGTRQLDGSYGLFPANYVELI